MSNPSAEEHAQHLSDKSIEAAMQGGNEADLRHHLWLFFQPWATQVLDLDQSALSQEGTGTVGRYDSRIGRAIIEYKAPGSLAKEKAQEEAAEQALLYVEDPAMAADVVIITDGTVWAHYRDASAEPEVGEQMAFGVGITSTATRARDRFTWRTNHTNSCERILSLIATVRTEPVTASTVARMLGPSKAEVRELIGGFASAIANRLEGDRTDFLFRQWIQMAGVSYGISDANAPWPARKPGAELLGDHLAPLLSRNTYAEALFCLHTYVALAAKVIGTELLSLATGSPDNRPSGWTTLDPASLMDRLDAMEAGRISDRLHSPGLLAGDLFGWYPSVVAGRENLAEQIRSFLVVLGELAWARVTNSARGITGDLLRNFYGAVVPRSLRRALGEFFTPQWLAERTLIRGIELAKKENTSARVLDPACGSGTFLVAALRRELVIQDANFPNNRGKATIAALDRVIGFDINPVAVLMSRINMLLALGDRIESVTEVVPRVYEADSILLPDPVLGEVQLHNKGDFRRLPLAIGDIDVPAALANLGGLHILRENVEQGVANGRSIATFRLRLGSDLTRLGIAGPELDKALDAAEMIYTQIGQLHEEGKDGVWGRIIEQAFAPATIGQVDLVVGNPPWINWKHLPDAWQSRSEPVWRAWGLWATKKRGGGIPLADISSLLLARSVVTYAAPTAIVAFLLPESVLIGDPGNQEVRRCFLRPDTDTAHGVAFRPLVVDDWTAVQPFAPDAANRPIALYVATRRTPTWPISKVKWRRVNSRSHLSSDMHWGEIAGQLAHTDVPIRPVEPENASSPWTEGCDLPLIPKGHRTIEYTWGQGFHTHGLDGFYVYEVLSARPDPDGLVEVRNVPTAGDNTKELTPRTGVVEAKFFWPLVRGQDVDRFRIRSSGLYALLPHDPDHLNEVLSIEGLIASGPRLFDFLEPWIDQLAGRFKYGKLQPSAEKPWGVRGPTERLTRSSPVVLCRYMHPAKRPPAALATPDFDEKLDLTTTCYPNNKSNVHVPLSIEEGLYLTGWINSEPAGQAIASCASSTTIGPTTLHRLPIPRFDSDDPIHIRIVEMTRAAQGGATIDEQQLTALVIESIQQ